MSEEFEPGFTLEIHEIRRIRPAAFRSAVTISVRTATQEEYERLLTLPSVPLPTKLRDWLNVVEPHIVAIEGLHVAGRGPVTTLEDAAALAPWVARVLYQSVLSASVMSPVELGKSSPQSSGDASMTPTTAATVDAED